MRNRRHIAALIVLIAAMIAGGCHVKGGRTDGVEPADRHDWPFVPAAVRIHPFTSIVNDDGGVPTLEARLEFIDQVGDVTKGVGDIRFELYGEATTAQLAGRDRQLSVWDAPLTTLDHNRRHYDPITRTYTFKLKLTNPLPAGQKLRLDVQVTDPSGRRMTATSPISAPAAAAPPAVPGK